jgi:hypothetical protein
MNRPRAANPTGVNPPGPQTPKILIPTTIPRGPVMPINSSWAKRLQVVPAGPAKQSPDPENRQQTPTKTTSLTSTSKTIPSKLPDPPGPPKSLGTRLGRIDKAHHLYPSSRPCSRLLYPRSITSWRCSAQEWDLLWSLYNDQVLPFYERTKMTVQAPTFEAFAALAARYS